MLNADAPADVTMQVNVYIMNPLGPSQPIAMLQMTTNFKATLEVDSDFKLSGAISSLKFQLTGFTPFFATSTELATIDKITKNKIGKLLDSYVSSRSSDFGLKLPLPDWLEKTFADPAVKLFKGYIALYSAPPHEMFLI